MPERQSRHPDNDLIDRVTDEPTPDQQGRAEGGVAGNEARVIAAVERVVRHSAISRSERYPWCNAAAQLS